MVEINLHQAAQDDLKINQRKSILSSSPFVAIVLLGIVLAVYGATMLYQKTLTNKRDALVEDKNRSLESIDRVAINELSDFQDRVGHIHYNVNNKKNPEDLLGMVEKLIVEGSFLNSLSYDNKENKITMEVVADSFRLAANQMLSLKKSELFEDVKIAESSRNQSNQAVFSLEAFLKKAPTVNQ